MYIRWKKRKFLTVDDILKAVRVIYPNATLQGSMCSYSFYNEGKLIGEAWISRNGKFWWARILEKAEHAN